LPAAEFYPRIGRGIRKGGRVVWVIDRKGRRRESLAGKLEWRRVRHSGGKKRDMSQLPFAGERAGFGDEG